MTIGMQYVNWKQNITEKQQNTSNKHVHINTYMRAIGRYQGDEPTTCMCRQFKDTGVEQTTCTCMIWEDDAIWKYRPIITVIQITVK